MRWRVLAAISLGVNLVLAIGWIVAVHKASKHVTVTTGSTGPVFSGSKGPNIVIRRQFLTWREIESPDYPTYIANLRDIGCPEQTIRDIIIADVNSLFSRRLATEIVTSDQQWWRTEPDAEVVAAAQEKIQALDGERRTLLGRLLGPTWESGDMANLPRPSRPGIVLDGPVLGALPNEVKQAIQDVNARSEQRIQAYVEAQREEGKEPDPVELAKLRQQMRTELAGILPPAQLEEFLLRYSQTANDLRTTFGQLRFFSPTPQEFRAVFRATETLDQQISLLADATDSSSLAAKKALEDQRENALRIALGPKRYQEYQLLHDPLYRDAVATAREAGTPEAAGALYAINLAAAGRKQEILGQSELTANQQNIELKQLDLDQLKAATLASGQELPPEPPSAPTPAPRRTYTVRQGDNAAVVAMIYGVPVSAIRAANPNVDLNRMKPGDSINIPRITSPPVAPP